MFFGYFLNIKKVTPSADFVIGPAKAEAFLFSHTRLPFPPRPLLPFGRISPAAKPRVRSSAPPFGFAAQKRARHFAARNHPVRLSASRPWLRHPAPLFCRSRHGCAAPGPQRQNPGPSGSLYPPLAALTSGHPFLRLESGWIFPRCLRISDKRKPVRPPYPVIIVRLRKSVFPEFSKRKQAKKQQKSRSGLHRCGLAFSGIFCFTRTWCL